MAVCDSKLIPLLPQEEFERRERRRTSRHPNLWNILDEVKDPEVPVVSIWELGVLQNVDLAANLVTVTLTPTYSGCPAVNHMAEDVVSTLKKAGYDYVEVKTRLQPAWSTSWISTEAKKKLEDYGVAPFQKGDLNIRCPNCKSLDVKLVSQFGSTACKALYKCNGCLEPFGYFKNLE